MNAAPQNGFKKRAARGQRALAKQTQTILKQIKTTFKSMHHLQLLVRFFFIFLMLGAATSCAFFIVKNAGVGALVAACQGLALLWVFGGGI